ncbi:MAG TPA: SDR family NAD(P)-dependent oxidoreductase [Acidimicrobiales bacterium]|nr:SDR family NAD(P)-dependent oxidoreductase [Acidimicrobiales bacterium]
MVAEATGRALEGRVAVVTGASRSIGKGIALELGAAGATVYVTGRSVDPGGRLPGTVAETAGAVTEAGGIGVPVRCDHGDDSQVTALFDRIGAEYGRLDLLVNNVFNTPRYAHYLGLPFWEVPITAWDDVVGIGSRSHYVAAALGVPLMLGANGGLIVNVSSPGAVRYMHNVVYGVGKAAVDKMTADMAYELRERAVSVVSVWPGLVRNEMLSLIPPGPDGRQVITLPGEGEFDVGQAETPRFTGRAVVALASDPDVAARSGRAFPVADLADDYGFTDTDGRVPRTPLPEEDRHP